MYNNELTVRIGKGEYKAFLQKGFYICPTLKKNLHSHNYAEVHIVTGGNAVFNVGGTVIETSGTYMLLIPGGVYHLCIEKEEETMYTAFQIDCGKKEVFRCNLNGETVKEFFKEIKACTGSGNYNKIESYIALFCSNFIIDAKKQAEPIDDYAFLIYEFFANRYCDDVILDDLAREIHLSQRQAERLVIEYMGCTFREMLAKTRIKMAKRLRRSTEMSLSQIAHYVGYHSYAGFWKAMKKYGEE